MGGLNWPQIHLVRSIIDGLNRDHDLTEHFKVTLNFYFFFKPAQGVGPHVEGATGYLTLQFF